MIKCKTMTKDDILGGSVWCTTCGYYWTDVAPYDREYKIPYCRHCKGPDVGQRKSKEYQK